MADRQQRQHPGSSTAGAASLTPVNIDDLTNSAAATTTYSMSANLPANQPAGFSQTMSMDVYTSDATDNERTFPVTWTAVSNNTWTMTVGTPTGASGTTAAGQLVDSSGAPVDSYSYTVSFNGDGSLNGFTALPTATGSAPLSGSGQPELTATWTDGAAPSTITLNLGTSGSTSGLSQFTAAQGSPSIGVSNTSQDGVPSGQLTGVSINGDGNVVGAYTNGKQIPIYKIPVVTFANENGLTALTSNVYAQSNLSGTPNLNAAGTNGAGKIEGACLELSTVDTTLQMSTMIAAQQAYSAASQVFSGINKMDTTLLSVLQ